MYGINKDCIDKGSTESVDSEILSCIKTKSVKIENIDKYKTIL